MQSLRSVLAAFRQEVLATLEDGVEDVARTRLEPDRIVLSLAVSIRSRSGEADSPEFTFTVPESGSIREGQGEIGHRLTVEFTARAPRRTEDLPEPTATPGRSEVRVSEPLSLEETEASRVVEALASVFGEPGFDSSARATVFRETLAGSDDSHVRAVVRALREGRTPDTDPAIKRSWVVLSRLVKSGPAKSVVKAGEILEPIFGQYAASSVTRVLEETWKTQDHWLNLPSGPPRSSAKATKGS